MKRTGNVGFIFGLAVVAGGMLLLVPGLRADDSDTSAPQAARAVRLSYVEGDVHLYQGNQALTDQAVANTPLFEGARVDTGNDGRAEIQFEDGSVARISPQSSVTLSVLQGLSATGQRDAELLVNNGLAYFELQGDSDSNHIRVRFGETLITTSGFTVLRVNVDKAPGEVAVFSGNAHMEGGASPAIDLHGGESVALNGADPNSYNLAETIEPDSWDAWNSDRDQDLNNSANGQTAATENQPDNKNPAWNDLDANGNWYNVPDQGYVWSPYDASNPDWDPYGNGYWMNTPGYGYMWISGYPWGYMPYQCGMWNWYSSFGWGWAPGGCSPWWGGYGGWAINIGFAPPRYRYPVRPPRPRNPRPMGGGPRPMVVVNRNMPLPPGTIHSPRDRTGSVLIAGTKLQPLQPIQQQRLQYRPIAVPGRGTVTGIPAQPIHGNPAPRTIEPPARPGNIYAPAPVAPPRTTMNPPPRTTFNPPPARTPPPPPSGGSYPRPAPPSRPSSGPPPSHFNGGGGGGHPVSSGGGGGGHPSGGGGHH